MRIPSLRPAAPPACRSTAPAPARMMTSAVPFLILFLVGVSFAERYWVESVLSASMRDEVRVS